jgi:uncharacterized membrane protein YfcA
MWGYRGELTGAGPWALRFALPSVAGGLTGALLLTRTPASTFSALVPWLVLGATLLFMAQGPLTQAARRHRAVRGAPPADAAPVAADGDRLSPPSFVLLVWQFAVAVYGGYFGAGIGILMLAALGFMGLSNIHRMNALKNWGGLCINAVAAVTFALGGLVNWPVAASMAAGATLGGYAGAGLARRVRQESVRRAIGVVGVAAAVWLFVERI